MSQSLDFGTEQMSEQDARFPCRVSSIMMYTTLVLGEGIGSGTDPLFRKYKTGSSTGA